MPGRGSSPIPPSEFLLQYEIDAADEFPPRPFRNSCLRTS